MEVDRMTYKQARKLDYETLCYSQFVCTTALYKRVPYRCLCYDSEKEATTLIIFSRTQNGTTITRHLRFDRSAAENVITRLQSDFGITVEVMDEAEEM